MLREITGVHQTRRKDKGVPRRGQHAQGTGGCLGDLGGRVGKLAKQQEASHESLNDRAESRLYALCALPYLDHT